MGETGLHVAADVGAVRALWDRSGLLAGPSIAAQLSAFAEALAVAHAARERGAAVLERTFDTLAMLRSSAHPRAAGVEAGIEHAVATYLHARDP